jgi:hypothetical protein
MLSSCRIQNLLTSRTIISVEMSLLRPLPTLLRSAAPAVRPSNLSNAAPARSKHSATQVKRLFKNNPARLRLLKKEGKLPNEPRNIPEHPTFPPVFQPTFLGNGWSAPPNPSEVQIPEYPFRVTRTGNKPFGAVGFLPVYRDVR